MSAAVNVHRELTGWKSISEFPDRPGNGLPAIRDACWIAAWMSIAHSYNTANPMTGAELVRLRADMTAHGDWTNGGISMSLGEQYARTVLKQNTIYDADWHYHGDASKAEAIHQALKVHAGINGAILQLGAAHEFPYNEPGVNSHFIGIGGIDSAAGYLCANGDDVQALAANDGHGKTYPARWIGWNQILKAQPTALLVIAHPTAAVSVPAGWKDDGATLVAKNGVHVVKGFRQYVLAQAWNADNVPALPEINSGYDTFQPFRDTTLLWSQATGIISRPSDQLQRAYLALATQPAPDPAGPAALALVKQLIKLGEAA